MAVFDWVRWSGSPEPRTPGLERHMRIGNVYRPVVVSCQAAESLPEVARRMAEEKVGALAVLADDHFAGIITERDLVNALAGANDPTAMRVAEIASTQVQTADVNDDTLGVARRMLEAGIRHLPVVDGGRLVGMVSMRDLLALETWAS